MTHGRLSKSEREVLARLVERHGGAAVVAAAKKMLRSRKKAGAPPKNRGNLAGVYGYVEFYRKQKRPGGQKLGVNGACGRLKRVLEKYTIGHRVTRGRLRTMYYEAVKAGKTDPAFAVLMQSALSDYPGNGDRFPLLLQPMKNGSHGVIIDRFGEGGRPI